MTDKPTISICTYLSKWLNAKTHKINKTYSIESLLCWEAPSSDWFKLNVDDCNKENNILLD